MEMMNSQCAGNMDFAQAEARVMGFMMDTKMINGVPMMSHLQINELTDKRQDNVKRTVIDLERQKLISFTQIEEMIEVGNGAKRSSTVYYINERDSHVVVARMSPGYTAFLVDFWMNNRKQGATPPAFHVPQTYLEALEAHLADQKKIALISVERDEAVRTKAHISEKREKTAMVTASIAVRKVKKLEEQLGESETYKVAKAIPWLKDYFNLNGKGTWVSIGQQLRNLSIDKGVPIKRVESSRYPNGVNAYHKDVIAVFKNLLDEDEVWMWVYRK